MKSRFVQILLIIWCMLEIFCFGALHIGWASLAYILRKEDFFTDGCNAKNETTTSDGNGETICSHQDGQLSMLYTVASGIMIFPVLLSGPIIGRVGLVKARIIYSCVFVVGFVLAIASSPDNPWLMAVGIAFIGGGGRVFFLSSAQKSSSLKRGSFIIMAAFNGCYDSSAAIFLLVKVAYDAGLSKWKSLSIILGLSFTTFLNTYFNFYSKKSTSDVIPSETSNTIPEKTIKQQKKTQAVSLRMVYSKYVWNQTYISHWLWFIAIDLNFTFTIASSQIHIHRVVQEIEGTDESSLTNIFSIPLLAGFVPALFTGIFLELFQLKLKGSLHERNLKTLVIGIITVNILSLLMAVTYMFYILPCVYTSFAILPVLRAVFFSTAYTFIAKMFPVESFAVLSSLIDLTSNLGMFAQKAIIVWLQSYDNADLHIRIAFAALSVVAMAHPILLMVKMQRLKKIHLRDKIDDVQLSTDEGSSQERKQLQ